MVCRIKYKSFEKLKLVYYFGEIAERCPMCIERDEWNICKSRMSNAHCDDNICGIGCPLCCNADMQHLFELDKDLFEEYCEDPEIKKQIKEKNAKGEGYEDISLNGGDWLVQWGEYVFEPCDNPDCKHWARKYYF